MCITGLLHIRYIWCMMMRCINVYLLYANAYKCLSRRYIKLFIGFYRNLYMYMYTSLTRRATENHKLKPHETRYEQPKNFQQYPGRPSDHSPEPSTSCTSWPWQGCLRMGMGFGLAGRMCCPQNAHHAGPQIFFTAHIKISHVVLLQIQSPWHGSCSPEEL